MRNANEGEGAQKFKRHNGGGDKEKRPLKKEPENEKRVQAGRRRIAATARAEKEGPKSSAGRRSGARNKGGPNAAAKAAMARSGMAAGGGHQEGTESSNAQAWCKKESTTGPGAESHQAPKKRRRGNIGKAPAEREGTGKQSNNGKTRGGKRGDAPKEAGQRKLGVKSGRARRQKGETRRGKKERQVSRWEAKETGCRKAIGVE